MSSRHGLLSGWRKAAVVSTTLTATLTVVLIGLFFYSVYQVGHGWSSVGDSVPAFTGNCSTAFRINIALHFAINAMATGVLASSSFFMQILIAPTRQDIDRAHYRRRWLEIGVQSWRNLFHIPWTKSLLWALFAITTIPLHLIFNSCVLETKGSTDFLFVLSSEAFTQGAAFNGSAPLPSQYDGAAHRHANESETLYDIQRSLTNSSWETVSLEGCYSRYNDSRAVLTSSRHVILVISNKNETLAQTTGWSALEVQQKLKPNTWPADTAKVINPVWNAGEMRRTDFYDSTHIVTTSGRGVIDGPTYLSSLISMDLTSGLFEQVLTDNEYWEGQNISSIFNEQYQSMRGYHCLVEPYEAPCKVKIEPQLLGVVVLICIIKCVLCVLVLAKYRDTSPLVTPGDAIESFIINPDESTSGMCSLSVGDIQTRGSDGTRMGTPLAVPKAWSTPPRRWGRAIPKSVWFGSYLLIVVSISVAVIFFQEGGGASSVPGSYFGPDSHNGLANIQGLTDDSNRNSPLVPLTIVVNSPQLILSLCYFAYNGLFTRFCAEVEWATYSTRYLPLRVTHRKGMQKSTYRLQLPYRWSVPLLVTSFTLHWLCSNCFYVMSLEGYGAYFPYETTTVMTIGYSSLTILISIILCVILAIIPLGLARCRLPGQMVMAGACSMVISAACHCVAVPDADKMSKPNDGTDEKLSLVDNSETGGSMLQRLAQGRIKWGVVSMPRNTGRGYDNECPGHLAFGGEDRDVEVATEGQVYV